MDDLYNSAVAQANTIMTQIASLKWVLILSGVGVVEGITKNIKRTGSNKKGVWLIPLLIGTLAGVVSFISDSPKYSGTLQLFAKATESAIVYCGWVTFAYYFTLRPIKYLGDWIKRKSAPQVKE
jgi:hypothetical protein